MNATKQGQSWEEYMQTMVAPVTVWSAARADDVAELRRLADEGADLNARDHRGHSPLTLATYNGNQRAFDFLMERGADPNSVDLIGNTVLMGAAFKGNLGMVQRLLEAGADPHARNTHGMDAIAFAATFGRHDIVTFFRHQGLTP